MKRTVVLLCAVLFFSTVAVSESASRETLPIVLMETGLPQQTTDEIVTAFALDRSCKSLVLVPLGHLCHDGKDCALPSEYWSLENWRSFYVPSGDVEYHWTLERHKGENHTRFTKIDSSAKQAVHHVCFAVKSQGGQVR